MTDQDKIQEVLAMVDLPEEQQIRKLYELGYTNYFVKLHCGRNGITYECKSGSLAGLAFRMRGEAVELGVDEYAIAYWERAKIEVWKLRKQKVFEVFKKVGLDSFLTNLSSADRYFADEATAIDIIAAALIAKILAKETATDGQNRTM